ncbi:hypothetical protein L1987_19594 [Smallanthus sonchifolius]|uniref:Uncharacterized protein n=1 Tax=Smallanthus sonchifolius TaxID=185202 RepID=A0ACB9IPW7_9ASTR|nr:hypothetical protein L1987_19594 [Smallanthus sonchifolius]
MEILWSRLQEFSNWDFLSQVALRTGIWYKKLSVRTVVWVANRDHPLPVASKLILKITDQGILGLFNNISMIWSSNSTTSWNATAKLRDNGNLVVIDQNEKVLWLSFDYPTDTLLPGMKLGRDYLRSREWHLSSWKTSEDPGQEDGRGWQLAVSFQRDTCDTYNICDAYGICSVNTVQQSCTCLDEKKFAPKNQKGWDTADWSGGCIRCTPLECKNGSEGFIKS